MRNVKVLFLLLSWVLIVSSSCYHKHAKTSAISVEYTAEQLDSLAFTRVHHYSENFNFVVRADSLLLIRQLPEEQINDLPIDSFFVPNNSRLVVADIRILSADSVDSVWVQLAQDQDNIGWIHESQMLPKVDPDDPISQFISTFSNQHLLVSLVVISFIVVGYLMWKLFRRRSYIVHFKDINSFYPTLLTLIVASSATFYSSIQLFAPETWRHFYFHPTLNPFTQPPILMIFLVSVWLILIATIAAIDDTFHNLPFGDAVLYLCGLAGVCAVDYIVFSILTLYYIGYPLLVAYVVFALWCYFRHNLTRYICGNCGKHMKRKGRCPSCGVWNK